MKDSRFESFKCFVQMDFFNAVFVVVVLKSLFDVQKYVLMLLLALNKQLLAQTTCKRTKRRKKHRFEIKIQQSQLYYTKRKCFAMMPDCTISDEVESVLTEAENTCQSL